MTEITDAYKQQYLARYNRKILTWIDDDDNKIGFASRKDCEKLGLKHRAMTGFLINPEGHLLVTQRSRLKPLWPLYLDCSWSTDVGDGLSYEEAARLRLPEELGIKVTDFENLGKFDYHKLYRIGVGSENEKCALFIAPYDQIGPLRPNPDEVAGYWWVSPSELENEINRAERKKTLPPHAPWTELALNDLKIKRPELFDS
ncbi:NUDIX domain-containing protein [Candidatus Pacearchaeota archaeon]|nr:NUDIX domain-containing protein [Candidatus Pacearchaeota archaeon]